MVAPIVLKANNGDEPLHTDGRIFTEFYPLAFFVRLSDHQFPGQIEITKF